MTEEEKEFHAEESLWYIRWALTFIVVAAIMEFGAFVSIATSNIHNLFLFAALGFFSFWLGGRLKRKSDEHGEKAGFRQW